MIHNYQTNNDQKIELVWVPSHVSIPGNDQADRCAKESRSLEDIESVEYSYSEFCSIVSSRINQKWADMLRNLDTARYQIDPKVPNQTKPNHPYCSNYPDVKNAYFNEDDNCVDISITCNEKYTMKQMIKCEDGEWKYQEPYCEPQGMTDCSNYPDVKNAYFNEDDNCVDISITCNEKYTMKQMIKCEDGEWKYQEPYCEPQGMTVCNYIYTYDRYIPISHLDTKMNSNQAECNELCNNNTQCTDFSVTSDKVCNLTQIPVVAVFLETDLNQCIAKCSEMNECLMMNHWPSSRCYIFNITQDDLADGDAITFDGYTLSEKLC
ncbi:hypothetical protein LOTGIDRAFT_174401 [Lottia gigantea]|uniref:Sushi domain-containing protein n=1 Tax=Lottia gigantea TaxID=225164 RepID=V4A2I0_LOTGI|nr:hypothetical protein LOTGIDRAFT_174401 [Lottia gigantea]ESO98073.1 hypothetical protein LOTGIDRAFT_174401 [Lottia gigantea]